MVSKVAINERMKAKVIDNFGLPAVEQARLRVCLACSYCMMDNAVPYWCKHWLLPITTGGDCCPYYTPRQERGRRSSQNTRQ